MQKHFKKKGKNVTYCFLFIRLSQISVYKLIFTRKSILKAKKKKKKKKSYFVKYCYKFGKKKRQIINSGQSPTMVIVEN